MRPLDFLLTGVGGQGTVLASSILAEVGLRAGYDVKKAEVHGMAQRGGSVSSHVRWGQQVHSPLISIGQADFLVALEQLEALRHLRKLRPGGRILVNDHSIIPVTVTSGDATYPAREEILAVLRQVTHAVQFVPGVAVAQELGNVRAHNVVLLGALSRWLDLNEQVWQDVIAAHVPPRYVDLNLAAFARGRTLV